MKHVNVDMDDLFRRASEKYPLRTDSADWNRLANGLDNDAGTPFDKVEDKRRRRGVFWWFLLLPLGGLGYFAWHMNVQHAAQKGNVVAVHPAGAAGTDGAVRTDGGARQGSAVVARPAGAAGGTEAAGSAGGTRSAAGAAGIAGSAGATRSVGASGAAGTPGFAGATGSAGQAGRVNMPISTSFAAARQGRVGGRKIGSMVADVTGESATGVNTPGSAGANTMDEAMTGNAAYPLLPFALDLRRVPTAGGYNLVVDVKAPGHATDSLSKAAGKVAAKSPRTSHGYIGILGAPDFSTVKFQTMKGVGTTFGILLGYSFNDRWAIESGVFLDRKRYYTEGEYFNTKNVATNYNKLLNVDGTCNMWEIPLNVRYNFNTSERMKWFATAGLSTYLMSNESYNYQDQPWPGGPVKDGYWKITSPSQYFFSVVNLSAGFEQRIGKIGSLRLEPYVRLPISGIGTGRLPIMSAGLNIGITHRLW